MTTKTKEKSPYLEYVDVNATWLQILRDSISENELIHRRYYEIDRLINGVGDDSKLTHYQKDFESLYEVRAELGMLKHKNDFYIRSIVELIDDLTSPSNLFVKEYLLNGNLSISDLAEDFEITYSEALGLLRKYERVININLKNGKIAVQGGVLEHIRNYLLKLQDEM